MASKVLKLIGERLRCFLFHRRSVMRLPGYDIGDVQCMCSRCGLMWLEHRPGMFPMEEASIRRARERTLFITATRSTDT